MRDEGAACRVCGRSALPHRSFACRSCRRGKPETWVARAAPREVQGTPVLSDEERAVLRPRGWIERSKAAWKRRASSG